MQDNNMSSIETQLSSLEKITEELESGKLPIDEAINLYTKGMELALSCKKNLDNLGQRIQLAKKMPMRLSNLKMSNLRMRNRVGQ